MCLECWGKRDKSLGNETSPCTYKVRASANSISRWKNNTLDVECDADRFACGLLYERYWKALDQRAAQGKNIKDEWNSGCDWPKQWQACGKLVSAELPDMTSWACNIFMEHRNEIMGYNLSNLEDARLDRWTSVRYAEQVLWVGVLRVPLRSSIVARKVGLCPKTISCGSQ